LIGTGGYIGSKERAVEILLPLRTMAGHGRGWRADVTWPAGQSGSTRSPQRSAPYLLPCPRHRRKLGQILRWGVTPWGAQDSHHRHR